MARCFCCKAWNVAQARSKSSIWPGSVCSLLTAAVRSGSHVNLRISAVRALERIGDPKSIPVLEAVLKEDAPDNFKAIVRYSINRIRLKRPPAPRDR